jgi:nitroimidazol reductase NimA-like FMN-containing flavoprotein (pyridoxamine 5'-phosphate oxidase superfamily)
MSAGEAPASTGLAGRREVDDPAQAVEDALTPGPWDHRGLRVLSSAECLDRVRAAAIGRLAFVDDGVPVVLPVNHGLDDTVIVFRTTWGSKLISVEETGLVAFEVDGIDEDRQTGWSVVAKGVASIVDDDADAARLDRLGLHSWAGADLGEDWVWVRILARDFSGREIARS